MSQQLTAIERTRSTDLNLQVRTDEGDTVTLTLHQETDLAAISYRYKSRGEDGKQALSLRGLSITSEQSATLSVEGSLSEQELADLRELVGRISDSLAGGSLASLPAAEDGAEMDSLAGYSLSLTQTQTLDIVHLKMREWRPAAPPSIEPAPAPSPVVLARPEPVVAEPPAETQPVDTFTLPGTDWATRLLASALRSGPSATTAIEPLLATRS